MSERNAHNFLDDSASALSPSWKTALRRINRILRGRDWWEHKVPCFLGIAYSVAWYYDLAVSVLWPRLIVILLAVVACAGYVSVLNDITDRDDDACAGKPNRMASRSSTFQAISLGLCIGLGVIAAWFLWACPVALTLYALNWLAFTLYSMPPVRLKVRGLWGVLADASGGQCLPTLWTGMFLIESTGHVVEWLLAAPLLIWSFTLGMHGILAHQLRDIEADRVAKVGTVVIRHGAEFVSRLIVWIIFPIEVSALVWLLVELHVFLAWPILALHLFIEVQNGSCTRFWAACRVPAADSWLPLVEYYKFYFPLTFLLALAYREGAAFWILAAQLLLFPHCFRQFRRGVIRFTFPRRNGSQTNPQPWVLHR